MRRKKITAGRRGAASGELISVTSQLGATYKVVAVQVKESRETTRPVNALEPVVNPPGYFDDIFDEEYIATEAMISKATVKGA